MPEIRLMDLPVGASVSDMKRTGLDHAWCQVCQAHIPHDQVRVTYSWLNGWGDVLVCPAVNCYGLALAANGGLLRTWMNGLEG